MYLTSDRTHNDSLLFDVCYVSESVRGLLVLLCGSLVLKSWFLPHGIEHSQLLQCDHAYQLSICVNILWKRKRYHLTIIIQQNER
jgi:hypothetical protein